MTGPGLPPLPAAAAVARRRRQRTQLAGPCTPRSHICFVHPPCVSTAPRAAASDHVHSRSPHCGRPAHLQPASRLQQCPQQLHTRAERLQQASPAPAAPAAGPLYHQPPPAAGPGRRRRWRRAAAAGRRRRARRAGPGAAVGVGAGGGRRPGGGQGPAHRHRDWSHLHHLWGESRASQAAQQGCATSAGGAAAGRGGGTAGGQATTGRPSPAALCTPCTILARPAPHVRCPLLFYSSPPGHLPGARLLHGHARRRAAAAAARGVHPLTAGRPPAAAPPLKRRRPTSSAVPAAPPCRSAASAASSPQPPDLCDLQLSCYRG